MVICHTATMRSIRPRITIWKDNCIGFYHLNGYVPMTKFLSEIYIGRYGRYIYIFMLYLVLTSGEVNYQFILSYSLYFFKFSTLTKMLNFIFVEVTWKFGYLKWLNFISEKCLRRHRLCLHAKWLICFGIWWQTFLHKMWVMGRGVPQNHKNKISRPYAIFMINMAQVKSKNH